MYGKHISNALVLYEFIGSANDGAKILIARSGKNIELTVRVIATELSGENVSHAIIDEENS